MSTMVVSGLLKLTELGVDMQHKICDACETVAHCSNHGCIPLQPAQRKPLTLQEIVKLTRSLDLNSVSWVDLVRAVEAAHSIG